MEFIEIRVETLTGEPSKEVTLENLGEFVWTDEYGLNSLAPYIIAPKLTRLDIDVTNRNPGRAQPTTPSSILPPDRVHIPLLSEPTTVVYVCGPSQKCVLRYPTDGHELQVIEYRSRKDSSNWFSHLVRPISFSKVKKLEIDFAVGRRPPVNFPIRMFEDLEELHLRGDVESLLPILLGPERDELASCTRKLSKIYISGHLGKFRFTPNTLTDVLRKRKEAGCPTAVKTVCIPMLDYADSDIDALREVAGDVTLNPDGFDCWALHIEPVFTEVEVEEDDISDSSQDCADFIVGVGC